jgi:FkbM family methyltransferase
VSIQPERPYFYLGEDRALTRLVGGQPFYVYTRDRSITPWIILGGTWEDFVDNVLTTLASPGDVFLDVGANQGYYTVKIGSLVGATGKVFAFEPNPKMFRFLLDNVELNALQPRVVCHQVAVGAEAGAMQLEVDDDYPGGARVLMPALDQATHRLVDVDVVRIDEVVPAGLVADLIKIDVEGFEPLVCQGMQGLLDRSPGAAVVCEISVAFWQRFGDPAELLRRCAGTRRIFRIGTDGLLDELGADLDSVLDPNFISYVLLLPDTADRLRCIRDLLRR